jgi:hypothetical protein
MTRNGKAYELPMLAPHIEENESGSWPTPDASMGNGGRTGPSRESGAHQKTLEHAVKMWPTPSANQQGGGVTGLNGGSGARKKVHAMVGREEGLKMTGGQLNPTWVEWLMGYPSGWTDLKDSETPSSLKSPSGSEGE